MSKPHSLANSTVKIDLYIT